MKLDIKAVALAGGILWGAAILLVTLLNLIWPMYGKAFLDGLASVYPGYAGGGSAAQVIVGVGYAFVDGGIAAGIFGWLYNCLSRR